MDESTSVRANFEKIAKHPFNVKFGKIQKYVVLCVRQKKLNFVIEIGRRCVRRLFFPFHLKI